MLATLATILRTLVVAEAMDDLRRAAINLAAAGDVFAAHEVGRTSNEIRPAWNALRAETGSAGFIVTACTTRRELEID